MRIQSSAYVHDEMIEQMAREIVESAVASKKPTVRTLSSVLWDSRFLCDLSLTLEESTQLRELANKNASLAAQFLNILCERFRPNWRVSAKNFGTCYARVKTDMSMEVNYKSQRAVATAQVVVHNDQVYYELNSTDDDTFVVHANYWKTEDVELVVQNMICKDTEEVLNTLALAPRLRVGSFKGRLQSLDMMDVERDDSVPTLPLDPREQSIQDYYSFEAKRGTRVFGGYYDFAFDESRQLNQSGDLHLQNACIEYPAAELALDSDIIKILKQSLSLVRDSQGQQVGHRVRADAKEYVPVHLFKKGSTGLYSVPSGTSVGLTVQLPVDGEEVYICFIQKNTYRVLRARVLRMFEDSFYVRCDTDLLPGTSGALIMNKQYRALGSLERVVSYTKGIYQAISFDGGFEEFSLQLGVVRTSVNTPSFPMPVYDQNCNLEGYRVPAVGDLVLTIDGLVQVGTVSLADMQLSSYQGSDEYSSPSIGLGERQPNTLRTIHSNTGSESANVLREPTALTDAVQLSSDEERSDPGIFLSSGESSFDSGSGGAITSDEEIPYLPTPTTMLLHTSRVHLNAARQESAATASQHVDMSYISKRYQQHDMDTTSQEYRNIRMGQKKELVKLRKALDRTTYMFHLTPSQVDEVATRDATELLTKIGLPEEFKGVYLLNLAFTHCSTYGGRQTNELLAMLGDSLLRTHALLSMVPNDIKIAHAQDFLSRNHSNERFKSLIINRGLQEYIVVGNGTTVLGSAALATVFEALFAALYIYDKPFALRFASEVLY